ncbi:MAG: T9SS type A sorting domain-containing protein [Sphingobacteriaceae bacterium]|nr:T9SS type A sorting domain-containing protein [Sphingobacteriaceae bacterium]
MKHFLISLTALFLFSLSNAQTRISLYEVFTGENSAPCYTANPILNSLLAQPSNTPLVIPIKWQSNLPSAPTNTWSLYQTNWYENYNRIGNYNINNASTGRLDGQNPTVFGATSDAVSSLTGTTIASAASYTTPFSITMNTSWDVITYTNAVVTVTVQSSQSFTSAGSFVFRTVLIEREIDFVFAPGTNGEKNFKDVARQAYPTIYFGTALPSVWTVGQSFTFTVYCTLPSYIIDKSQMAFVGYVQDDGNKKVWQAHRTNRVGALLNDAKLTTVSLPSFSCANAITPTITVLNQGSNAITAMTIITSIDGIAQTPFNWNGSLASLSTSIIALSNYTASAGNHTISTVINSVSGGDINNGNNKISIEAALIQTFFAAPISQSFTTTANFPPTNWFVVNPEQDATWVKAGSGSNGSGSAKINLRESTTVGLIDELYLPPSNLTAVNLPMLTFDVAFSQYISTNDKLEVKISTDCGSNWITVYNKAGATLATSPPQFSIFTPTVSSQWRHEIITLPASAANNPNVLVKFVSTSDLGNNLYIDNVNLGHNITGVGNNSIDNLYFEIYPNPSNDFTNLILSSKTPIQANIIVYDLVGKVMIEKIIRIEQGYNTIPLDLSSLNSGIYNLLLNSANLNITKKIAVTR